MARQTIAQLGTSASRLALRTAMNTELEAIDDNFDELYPAVALCAPNIKREIVVPTGRAFAVADLTNTIVTNEGQTVSADVANTVAAPLVAGMEWTVIITETLNTGKYWQLTVPLGHSISFNGTMGTNNGYARFTTPVQGDTAHFKTVTINGGVCVICESTATTLTVT